jgi:hypothetical protein
MFADRVSSVAEPPLSAIAMALESLRTAGRAEEDLATAIREALAVLRDTLPRKRRPNR